jgi:hypothetical protein
MLRATMVLDPKFILGFGMQILLSVVFLVYLYSKYKNNKEKNTR